MAAFSTRATGGVPASVPTARNCPAGEPPTMVSTAAAGDPRPPPVTPPSARFTVLRSAGWLWFTSGTVMVLLVSPWAKVSVPLTGV